MWRTKGKGFTWHLVDIRQDGCEIKNSDKNRKSKQEGEQKS